MTPLDQLSGPDLDRLLFGRMLDVAAAEPGRPLTEALGLERAALDRLVERHAPERRGLVARLGGAAGTGEDALEEPDLRALLLEYGTPPGGAPADEVVWLAAIVARRSLGNNHLWQDMGFANRRELNALLRRWFPALVAANSGDMKWKKFFYRQLCEREGIVICKSPNCEVCDDVEVCFSPEEGDPLADLARNARPTAA